MFCLSTLLTGWKKDLDGVTFHTVTVTCQVLYIYLIIHSLVLLHSLKMIQALLYWVNSCNTRVPSNSSIERMTMIK